MVGVNSGHCDGGLGWDESESESESESEGGNRYRVRRLMVGWA